MYKRQEEDHGEEEDYLDEAFEESEIGEMSSREEEEEAEDTVDEAPSIQDEVGEEDEEDDEDVSSAISETEEESSESSTTRTSGKWSTAENVFVMVKADHKLKEAQQEGHEVSELLVEAVEDIAEEELDKNCLLYTSPSPRD